MIKVDAENQKIYNEYSQRHKEEYDLKELVGKQVYYKTAKVNGTINENYHIIWDDGVEPTDMLDSSNELVLVNCELV